MSTKITVTASNAFNEFDFPLLMTNVNGVVIRFTKPQCGTVLTSGPDIVHLCNGEQCSVRAFDRLTNVDMTRFMVYHGQVVIENNTDPK